MAREDVEVNQSEEWALEIQRQLDSGQYPKWPNEAMVKVLFGGSNYLKTPVKPQPDWRVLDVGCLFANNLLPFAEMGCDCHGVDIHPKMVETARTVAGERGIQAEFKVGSNRALPYSDGYFDLLLSVGTIHYEGSEENVMAALKEFRRVLKPGGRCFISTTGPDHEIYKKAKLLGNHRYQITDFDFRNDQIFFFFDTERYFHQYLSQVFRKNEIGRELFEPTLFTENSLFSVSVKH